MRPYRARLAGAVAVSTGVLAAQVLQPQIVKLVVDDVLRDGQHDRLVPYALTALGLGIAASVFAFFRRNFAGAVSLGLEYDLRNRLYAHLQRLDVGFHDGWQSGQLVSRAISDISRIRRFLGFGLLWLVIIAMTFAWVLVMLVRLDPVLAAITVALTGPVAVVSRRFGRVYHDVSSRSQDEQGDLTTTVEEAATGVRVIKAFGRQAERSALFAGQARTLLGTNLRGVRARANFWALDSLLLNLNLVAILAVGGVRVTGGALSVGGLVAFVSYQLMLIWPARDVGWIIAMAEEAVAAAERVFEILDTEPRITDRDGARALPATRGHLRFEGVDFRYPDASDASGHARSVLHGLDLDVRPGETLALVGMTGSGKSTILSLVGRFYDPTHGRLTVDGVDVRDLTLASLRRHIGFAFEDPILFSASVRENVRMGAAEATDDDVWAALEAAQAAAFVRELPWGLDTRVGEQGHSLSGGQRQRIALARAVVGRPAVLVLDNPLSSVDVHTEAAIEQALRVVLRGRTALLVAHRPSTILLADRVALVDGGRVVATGTHQELLATTPMYRDVVASDAPEEVRV